MNKKIAIAAFVVSIGVLIAHIIGTNEYLYVRISGYDIPMHFFGGAAVTLGLATFLSAVFRGQAQKIWLLIVATALVATGWELFETHYDIAGAAVGTQWYWIDSIKDVIVGSFGAAVASWFIRKIE